MNTFSRRQLLKMGVAGAAGAMTVPYFIPSGVLASDGKPGPNEQIGVGIIGVGRRGPYLLDHMPAAGRIVALCDCNLPKAEAYKEEKKGDWPVYQDYRKILDRKDIDGVIVATAEFQRIRPAIHACQAGKDIYVEKPLTLYIREGRAMVDAVRKYQRVCQVGTQQRSMVINRIACQFIREGGLGKLKEVRARTFSGPDDCPVLPEENLPERFNWDVWLNQAPYRPYNKAWMDWEHWRDFSGNWMTNFGAHAIDMIQWSLGMDDSGPVEARPLTPGTSGQCEMRYANGVPVRFVMGTDGVNNGPHCGAIFTGEKGKIEMNRNMFKTNPPEIADEIRKMIKNFDEEEAKWGGKYGGEVSWHIQNWLDCIRTREKPNADVEIGHRTLSAAHVMNITRRLGRALKWDPAKEQFIGDDEANTLVDRPRRKGYELPDLG